LLNLNVALLNLRAILGNGPVVLAGDVVGLFYVSDGLPLALNLGGANACGLCIESYKAHCFAGTVRATLSQNKWWEGRFYLPAQLRGPPGFPAGKAADLHRTLQIPEKRI